MVVTSKPKRTAEEKIRQRKRIAQDKARARRWAEQRRNGRNARTILPTREPTIRAVAVPHQEPTLTAVEVPSQHTQENSRLLQDLFTRRSSILQELSEIAITIEAIQRTYSSS